MVHLNPRLGLDLEETQNYRPHRSDRDAKCPELSLPMMLPLILNSYGR